MADAGAAWLQYLRDLAAQSQDPAATPSTNPATDVSAPAPSSPAAGAPSVQDYLQDPYGSPMPAQASQPQLQPQPQSATPADQTAAASPPAQINNSNLPLLPSASLAQRLQQSGALGASNQAPSDSSTGSATPPLPQIRQSPGSAAGTDSGQQPPHRNILQTLGNIALLPIHGLSALSDEYSNLPVIAAQNTQMRDLQIKNEQLNQERARAGMDMISRVAWSLGDHGPPPAQSGPANDQPPPDMPLPGPQGLTPPMPNLPSQNHRPPGANLTPGPAPASAAQSAPRGIRNNNPGNVMALPNGQQWQGQTGVDGAGYATFGDMKDGIRATLVNLQNQQKLHGANTVGQIVGRWAPATAGNNTGAYTNYVAKQLGVDPDEGLDLQNDKPMLGNLAQAMFQFENGPKAWDNYTAGGAPGASSGQAGPPPGNGGYAGPLPKIPGNGLPPLASGGPSGPGAQAPAAGSAPGSMSPMRRGLATMALINGKPEDAWSIMKGDVVPDAYGNLIDHTTGGINGRAPTPQYVNGYRVDPGAPNAPSYIPKLPDGTIPDGKGGVMPIPGASDAAQQQSYADAAGKNQANWPGDLITVPGPDGTPHTMSRSQFAAMSQGARAPGPGTAPGSPGAIPGVAGADPAHEEFAKSQAQDASKTLSSDMDVRPQAIQNLESARQALSYVQSHANSTNPATPFAVAGANYLRAIPADTLSAVGVPVAKITQFANDAGVYQRLSSQNLLSFSKSNLPSRYTEREMAVAGKVIPQLSTAPDAATFHWGLQAAIANKELQRADFAANYQGAPSRQGVEQTWNATPGGQTSLFEDPVWQGLKIGGKPAVVYVQKGGRSIGVVGMGTSAPTTFYASGAH
jgi:hypothetical protein